MSSITATLGYPDIRQLVRNRWMDQGPVLQRMEEVRRRANADYVVPLPDVAEEPTMPQLTPLLVANAIDKPAQRAASVQPWLGCPAVNPAVDRSRDYARIRQRALPATLWRSRFPMIRRRYYRHMAAYATTCLQAYACPEGVKVKIRNPLAAFPEPRAPEDLDPLNDIAYVYEMPVGEILRRWPEAEQAMHERVVLTQHGHSEGWLVFEWHDPGRIMWGLAGPKWIGRQNYVSFDESRWRYYDRPLEVMPNRANMVTAVMPQRVTLDRLMSPVSNMLGLSDLMGRLLNLEVVAQERAIFPDRFVVAGPNGQPRLKDNRWKDGREGELNILQDVTQIGELRGSPDPGTRQLISMLERNFNVSTDMPSPVVGETSGYSMRTGRGIDTLLGASIDPAVQELHEISEAMLPSLMTGILACYEGYHPERKFVMFSGMLGDESHVEFTPRKHFTESKEVAVSYAIAGADVQATTVQLGQLLGMEAISIDSFRKKHPWIADAEAEGRKVDAEKLRAAMMNGLQQKLASGELPPVYAARIQKELMKGTDLADAIVKVDEEIRAEQAAQLAQQQQAPPELPMPQQMPGLEAGPGAPLALPPGPIAAPPESQNNLRQMLRNLGTEAPRGSALPVEAVA